MTAADILLIAVLGVFVGVWWRRTLPGRPAILAAAAAIAAAAGAWGVIDHRLAAAAGGAVGLLFLAGLGISRLRRAPPRKGPPWITGSLAVLLAAAAVACLWVFPVAPLPKPSGPDAVGVQTFELDDASRPGLFGAKPGEPRRLLVRVWYPAGDVRGRKPAPYISAREAAARSRGETAAFPLKHIRTHSYPDAPLKPGVKDLPVVFYSHGYGAFLAQNTVLMEHLASHGYVVVSVQHPYDSQHVVFPNGDVTGDDPSLKAASAASAKDEVAAEAQKQSFGGATPAVRMAGFLKARERALAQGTRLQQSGIAWAADRMFVHDQLQAGAVPAAARPVFAAARLDRVGEMGMSFGGATAGTVCVVDRRCAAGINLDGGDFPFQAFGRPMPVPFLMFHSDLGNIAKAVGATPVPGPAHSFNEFSYEAFAVAGTRPDIIRTQMRGAQHLGISDFALFMRRPARDPLLGSTPTPVMIGAQNDFVLGFFDRYLLGRANGFPQAQFGKYRDWVTPVSNTAVRDWWLSLRPEQQAEITGRIESLRSAR